ncbi:MAG: efflux RND transporter periplasmic adaptor subunit [Verrucomicrobia bacterium]|jgi:RND family efflux transporter MFP subunit|nr:efflux RND transporter periplasmic adaptor subunit [Verrucomicrobiota bacterium]MBT7064750.1 efflux RND transporter periplasmic adaptor subunit [Verrucomicrobiota bacterium]MBT7699170.1 efflux RND transporter periplasmic adaptor subunit [Verrucomicrobiota bacterium]
MKKNCKDAIKRGVMTVAGGLLVCLSVSGCGGDAEHAGTEAKEVPVRVQAVREMTFSRELHLQGSLESVSFALVPAKANGSIERILVEEGDTVTEGQPLCELDSENLRHVFQSQEQGLAVASNSLVVAEAQAAQARAARQLADKDFARFKQLSKEQVISVHQMDEADNRAVSAGAALDVAGAQVELARARVEQAKTARDIARRNLEDATVRAPIAGRISMRHHEQGEMVHVGDPVFRIDDPSVLRVSVFAPAKVYGEVIPGTTVARIKVGNTDLGERPVSYCSPTVDQTLRTFEIRARIDNPPAGVVAGGQADVRIVLAKRQGNGVPADALLSRGGKTVAFFLNDAKAHQAEVQTGIRTEGFLEIVAGIAGDATVIVEGQQYVNDGDHVVVVED